jgi:hypothetical protein
VAIPSQLRAFFYTGSVAVQREQFQKLGFVSVSYQVGAGYPPGGYDYELTRKVGAFVRALPVRFVSIYLCYSSSPWKQVADVISHIMSPILRVRLRSIQGSHQECLYQLMSLGIPIGGDCFPVDDDGRSRLDNHVRWVQMRQQLERKDEEVAK